MMIRRLLLPILAVMGLLLAGCAPKDGANDKPSNLPPPDAKLTPSLAPSGGSGGKYALFITNANSPFWDSVEAGMKKGTAETGAQAKMQRNTAGDVAGQIDLLTQALTKKDEVLGVCVSVLEPGAQGIADAMKKLRDAGVPVITMDADGKAEARTAFIGTNNLEAGKLLGQKVKELIPGGGKYCAFVGTKSAQNARDRIAGFKQGAGDKFVEVEIYEDAVDPNKAQSNAETALTAHADASILLGLWSYNGPLLGRTVKDQKKLDKVKVICFDAEQNLLPLLADGTVTVTCVQRPYEFGRQGVALLNLLAKGDKAGADKMLGGKDFIDTGVDIVTKENYPQFKAGLDAKGLKGS